jgi:GNAT superfamily N-acetyltransferase
MTDTITLRPARACDAEAMLEITARSVEGLAKAHYTPAQIKLWTEGRTADYYRDAIAKGRAHVAEQGGRVVGFVDSEPGELTRLFILPGVAGKGLGARLMEVGLAEAKRGHTGGPIRIEATRNAVPFYEKFGFKVVGHGTFTRGEGNPPIEIVKMEGHG